VRPGGVGRDRALAERFGRWAELCCVWRLRLSGYSVLARRFRTPMGEIDIVARRGDMLVFVEVKARPDTDAALFSLTERQLRRIARAADAFVARYPRFALYAMRYDAMVVGRRFWPMHVTDIWRPPAD
jgi:putative endonuclease